MTKHDMTKEQWRLLVEQWERAAPELERIHCEELRAYKYNPRDADAVLKMGDYYHGTPRLTSGLVEMQYWFRKLAEKQGLIPTTAREDEAPYSTE